MIYTSLRTLLNCATLILILGCSLPALASQATKDSRKVPCNSWLSAFALYEDEIRGQIVVQHSLYPIPDWDPNSQYDGVVLLKQPPGKFQTLEVEYRSVNKALRKVETYKDVLPFERDARLRQFDDFKPHEFFKSDTAGTYSIRLKSDGKLVCEESHRYEIGH